MNRTLNTIRRENPPRRIIPRGVRPERGQAQLSVTKYENLITEAHRVATLENGSQAWLEERNKGIGGSDVAAILGYSKWESAYSLWCKKTGRIQDSTTSSAMEWGNRLEDVVIDKFADEHPEYELLRNVGSWANNLRPWQKANPDALYMHDGELCLLEIKTAQYEDDWKTGTPGEYTIPNHYFTQVQWYLQALGLKRGTLAVLFHGNLYVELTFSSNQFEQDVNLQDCAHFWELVQNDIKPEWDGSDVTVEAVRKQHPDIDADASVELMELATEYMIADKQVREYQATLNAAKAQILDIMGNAKYGTQGGEVVFVRSARGQGVPYLTVKKGSK